MNLGDIVTPERTRILADVTSKKRALEQLSEVLAEDVPYLAGNEIFSALVAREKLGSTGLGNGVAIPHGRLAEVDECIGAMVRLPEQGVDFEAPDNQPVDILFGLLVPRDSTEDHLDILRGLAEMFSQPDRIAAVRDAEDEAALFATLLANDPILHSD